MIVVSDTSPISSLLQIGRAELLPKLYDRVLIPTAVRDELFRFHAALPSFLEICAAVDQARVTALLADLDQGEAEAIVLAAECHADYLLIDERRGRKVAEIEGIPTIGLLGALLLAKQRLLISSVKDCIIDLQNKAGFYVAQPLIDRVIEAANER